MEFREYAAVLARRWWVVALVVVAAVIGAFVVMRAQSPGYRATVRLEAVARIDQGQVMATERLLRQLAARARTTAVAEEVERRLQTNRPPEELMNNVRTVAVPDVLHVQIEAVDSDPARARRLAQTWAEVVQERQAAAMANAAVDERVLLLVLDRASPAVSAAPGTASVLAAAALAGLLAGALLAFLIDYADPSKRPSPIEETA